MTVHVPHPVYLGLEEVRQRGETNMLDVDAVEALAMEYGHPATVKWLQENKEQYINGIFEGIESEENNGEIIQRSGR